MEEESLGDKKLEKSSQKSYHSQENSRSTNTRKSRWAIKVFRSHGAEKILFSFIFLSLNLAYGQSPPPNYNYKKLPETSFTCEDKATGGYYADPEAGCQMFHVCLRVSEEQINDFKFLCPNNTVFDQQNFICTNWWEIDCERSTRYYSKNDLFKIAEETTTAEPPYEEQSGYYEYVYEYVDPEPVGENKTNSNPTNVTHRIKPEKKGRSFESTTTRSESTNDKYTSTTLPAPTTTSGHVTTSNPETTPKITTFRYRHRFAYQSEDNIGRRAYQIKYANNKEKENLRGSNKNTEPKIMSKSFDTNNEQVQKIQFKRRKKTNSSRSVSSRNSEPRSNSNTKLEQEGRIKIPESSNVKEPATAAPRVKALRRRTNRKHKSASKPKEKHKEFSNFRFYKTAFGRSYSSDDYLQTTTTTPRSSKRRARFRRPKRVRTGRTASRNTRYSKYAR